MARNKADHCQSVPDGRANHTAPNAPLARDSSVDIVFFGKLVPEARLELARLASEVFETSASTIPPLGPADWGLAAPAGGVNGQQVHNLNYPHHRHNFDMTKRLDPPPRA